MKTHLFSIALVAFIVSMLGGVAHAATEQWRHGLATDVTNINYYVDQIVADGKGGCVASVWAENTDTYATVSYYVAYFDKKGTKVWEKTYYDRDGEIAYCNSKVAVIGLGSSTSDYAKVIAIDKKGVESVAEDPAADIYGELNSQIGPIGDKKGFIVEEEDIASRKISLVRYSYK